MDQNVTFKYDVFISYSRKDLEFAKRLERALRAYLPPNDSSRPSSTPECVSRSGRHTRRRVERWLNSNLRNSAKLIVLCSQIPATVHMSTVKSNRSAAFEAGSTSSRFW